MAISSALDVRRKLLRPGAASLALLAVAAAVLYFGIIGVASLILGPVEPQGPISLAATGLVAATVGLMSGPITRLAGRLVRSEHAAPDEVLLEYSEKIRGSYADEDILSQISRALRSATGAREAIVWLVRGDQMVAVASDPETALDKGPASLDEILQRSSADLVRPITQAGETIGALTFTMPAASQISPVERSIVDDFAAHAGLVLKNVRLTEELSEKVQELEARTNLLRRSRRSLVMFQDAERRKIERDIHDGSQQRLVALTIKLKAAERLSARDPERALIALQECRRINDDARRTLIEIVRGVHSENLVIKGVGEAIADETRDLSLRVEIDDRLSRRYSREVETAVYFACIEAVQNAVKHADASRVAIALADADDGIRFAVTDDGRGFDPGGPSETTGLRNIKQRISALSGRLELVSTPGLGTKVSGWIPDRTVPS